MRSVVAAVAVWLAVGLLMACGGQPQHPATGTSAEQTGEAAVHNSADVTFSRNMITHHEQTQEMAQIAPTNTTNQKVIAMANQLIATQVPQMQAFRSSLMAWQDAQGSADSDLGGHDEKSTQVVGMVDQATMTKLQRVTGAEFDKLWLTSMIDHNRGAITMAQDELARGRNPDVRYLAQSLIASHQAEIDQMNQILGG